MSLIHARVNSQVFATDVVKSGKLWITYTITQKWDKKR